MKNIGEKERTYPSGPGQSDGPATSSYHPQLQALHTATADGSIGDLGSANAPATNLSPWLPCHYFDYIAGTSTGGLESNS